MTNLHPVHRNGNNLYLDFQAYLWLMKCLNTQNFTLYRNIKKLLSRNYAINFNNRSYIKIKRIT